MPDSTTPAAPFDASVTFFYAADLARTAAFWEERVGLPLVLDQGSCRIYRIGPTGYVGFCQRPPDAPPPATPSDKPGRGPILTLVTEDVDDWAERLRARGVSLLEPPRHNARYGIYHCFFQDPDGLLAEIQRFEDPGWPKS